MKNSSREFVVVDDCRKFQLCIKVQSNERNFISNVNFWSEYSSIVLNCERTFLYWVLSRSTVTRIIEIVFFFDRLCPEGVYGKCFRKEWILLHHYQQWVPSFLNLMWVNNPNKQEILCCKKCLPVIWEFHFRCPLVNIFQRNSSAHSYQQTL